MQPLDAHGLEQAWTHLASSDAREAHRAIWALAASPNEALPFLRQHLQPAPEVPAERIRQLLVDLDGPQFKEREAASRTLAELGEQAEESLTIALKGGPSAELRSRIEALLAQPRPRPKPEMLRALRALEILDQIGTPEAQAVLHKLARGGPKARLTLEAKASLDRCR